MRAETAIPGRGQPPSALGGRRFCPAPALKAFHTNENDESCPKFERV
jgi:hypothetical protein